MVLDKKNYIFNDMKGQTLVKNPGIIDGYNSPAFPGLILLKSHGCLTAVLQDFSYIVIQSPLIALTCRQLGI